MSRRKNWYFSSSSLRLCLKLYVQWGYTNGVRVEQFEMVYFNGTFYLFNHRSCLILATLKPTDGNTLYIRYRARSRYYHILEKWAQGDHAHYSKVIALPSSHVGRWERRMRYVVCASTLSREDAIAELSLGVGDLYDGLTRLYGTHSPRRQRRRRTNQAADHISQEGVLPLEGDLYYFDSNNSSRVLLRRASINRLDWDSFTRLGAVVDDSASTTELPE
jgi:hypothetical protein